MKDRKNILTYIVAAVATLVTSASSSLGVPPLQPPQNYTGRLTHGEFISCEGQILNPPASSVGGTWVLNIDRMTQPQVPPPAHLTMIVFRDGSRYITFPQIELTPVSLQNGIYTYTWGTSVVATLDTNTTPATFAWQVELEQQLHSPQLRIADLLRSSQQLGHNAEEVSASHPASFRCDGSRRRDRPLPPSGQRRRVAGTEPKTMPLVVRFVLDSLSRTRSGRPARRSTGSTIFLQWGADFREGMGNGLSLRVIRNNGHKRKTRKENQIMKNPNISSSHEQGF